MLRLFRGAARSAILLVVLGSASAPARAQGTITAYLTLRGTAQGSFDGESTTAGHKGDIVASEITMSQPYGAATPLLHVVTGAGIAPQIVRALVTNEVLVTPTVIFVKPGGNGVVQQLYGIKAVRGYIASATISADANHRPTVAFDLLLSGGIAYTNESGAPTTAPPPSIVTTAPAAHGIVLTGEFTGQTMGDFPASPGAPGGKGIFVDSVAITMTAPVANGMTAGKALAHPLVVSRSTSEDKAQFDFASANQQTFSEIVLHVTAPVPTSTQPVEILQLTTHGACFGGPAAPCGAGAGMQKPGGSTGLASGTGTASRSVTAVIGIRRIANDAITTMQLVAPTLTVTDQVTHATVTHSFATNTTN